MSVESRALAFVIATRYLIPGHRQWWNAPSTDTSIGTIAHNADLAADAGIAAVFQSDFLGISREHLRHGPLLPYEPLTFLAALAARTRDIGLVATVSTQFTEPYNAARIIASLEQLSGGRSGWNAVTSFNGERNFGDAALPDPATRYRRAAEFIAVVERLWDGWRADAVIRDRESRIYVDTRAITETAFHGEFFHVEEPLDIPRSPQQRPVLFQAGASAEGVRLAGETADAVFVAAPARDDAQRFSAAVKARARAAGRRDSDVLILPGLNLYLGASADEAQEAYRSVLSDADLVSGKEGIRREFPQLRFLDIALDDRIPEELVPSEEQIDQSTRRRSRAAIFRRFALEGQPTLRQFLTRALNGYGHAVFVGTPDDVAKRIVEWGETGASDGFVFQGGNSFDLLINEVLPRLKRYGAVRSFRTGRTLRERLGLATATIPESITA